MPKNDIGGFFVSLGLNPDKNSFETGTKLIDAVSTSLNKLIGTARNAAVVLAGTAVATGAVESANYKTATKIGLTTEKLNELKAAAKIAGVNADSLVGSVSKLANVMTRMTIDGSGLEAFSKQLGELGLISDEVDIEKLLGLDPDELMKEVIRKAQDAIAGGENRTRVTQIVADILGDAGADFFVELDRQGKSIDQFMAGARSTQLTTNEDANNGANFISAVNELKVRTESIAALLGDKLGEKMTKYVYGINDWLDKNGSSIKTWVSKIADTTDKVIGASVKIIGDWWEQHGNEVTGFFATLAQEVAILIGWLTSEKGKSVVGGLKKQASAAWETSKEIVKSAWNGNFSAIPDIYLNGLDDMWDGIKQTLGIEDGIIRPDGKVTPIAPDDWVIAARDLGDLAKAFVPQNVSAGTQVAEYSIVQNFTINGGSDLPQVLRQQAYNGTQEGLLAVMNQSSRRLQLMSGTL